MKLAYNKVLEYEKKENITPEIKAMHGNISQNHSRKTIRNQKKTT